MRRVPVTITAAMDAVEITSGGALPEKIIQFVDLSLNFFEFSESNLLQ